MWKKMHNYLNQKKKDAQTEEPTEPERVKQFKASEVETWTYRMSELPLRHVEEGELRQTVTPKKAERVMGESV